MNDKLLKQILQTDFIGTPDPDTELRLQQAFLLKSAAYRTMHNSFSGFFGWLFAPRQIAVKVAFAAVIAAFFFIRPGLNTSQHMPAVNDSTGIDQSRVQDSAFLYVPNNQDNDSVF